jgi:hypothetical protein
MSAIALNIARDAIPEMRFRFCPETGDSVSLFLLGGEDCFTAVSGIKIAFLCVRLKTFVGAERGSGKVQGGVGYFGEERTLLLVSVLADTGSVIVPKRKSGYIPGN